MKGTGDGVQYKWLQTSRQLVARFTTLNCRQLANNSVFFFNEIIQLCIYIFTLLLYILLSTQL